MDVRELENFANEGFGWICKKCGNTNRNRGSEKSRLMTEGEAESKQPKLSNKAMAKWKDPERKILYCPICEVAERI